jgi:acid phosphatase
LEAVARLLVRESSDEYSGRGGIGSDEMYVSFVHDGDVVPVLAALGVLDEDKDGDEDEDGDEGEGEIDAEEIAHRWLRRRRRQHLPTTHVKHNRRWRTSDVVPKAGRVVIERLKYRTSHGWRYRDVRLWINDGWEGWVVDAEKGKGRKYLPQMEVGRFGEMVRARKEASGGGFAEVCGVEQDGVEAGVGFLHQ